MIRDCFQQLLAQTLVDFWVADDKEARDCQCCFGGVDAATQNAGSFMVKTVKSQLMRRQPGVEHLMEDGSLRDILVCVILAVHHLCDLAPNLLCTLFSWKL